MRNLPIDPSKVPGWGIDANPENDPTYPMRDRSHEGKRGISWKRPPQQKETVEILQSIERNNLTAVFGTSTPPSGLSGMIRRQAFRYSESEWAHWLMLMTADRVNVVEGLVEDLGRGRVPNIPGEMGIRSELEHNRLGLMRKALVAGAVVGLGILAVRIASADRGGRRPGTRRG
ncbi:hypothetical protein MEX01_46250 [Methylorubrum extorquens]|uniref:hypothetical protein n=1 Tax=Methylorubrum extorquens TaxID=408 RepID=UPI00116D5144|nr:hypothetical protein [Methylorubrum extorquens]GEL44034.1 hypothetical protein MEX01_46250 [Methylorubrum extorquens]